MGNDLKKKIDQFRERLEGCSDLWEEASVELEFGEMLIEAQEAGDLVTRSEMEVVEKRLEKTQAKLYSLEKGVWRDGEPDKISGSEWFIAETEWQARVVLRRLDDDHSYDYETAEETFVTSERAQIKRWMQFPDSHFLPPDTHVSLAALEEAVAKAVAEEREAIAKLHDEEFEALVEENGSYDPSTNHTEFPEWVEDRLEWHEEYAAKVRARSEQKEGE